MTSESNSRSARRTKHLFKDALVRLLETESFACISVKDIVETAEYNRTTFYNHYYDKYDLLDDLTQDLLDGFATTIRSSFGTYHPSKRTPMKAAEITIFDYVHQHRQAISLCFQNDEQKKITLKSLDTIYQELLAIWATLVDAPEKQLASDARLFTYTLAGTIGGWMDDDFRTPPEEVRASFVAYHNQAF